MRGGRRVVACAVVAASLWVVPRVSQGADSSAPDACTDPETAPLDLSCVPGGTAGQLLRQACSYRWVDGVCDGTAFDDPGYAATADPSPGQPLQLLVGAVHEHSSYSDGDPTMIPRDYFRAASTGHNVADAGGDTGVILDFLFSSEHSDNGQIPITTSAACLEPTQILMCNHVSDTDHFWKWPATLRQAREATTADFTAMRGFEWTNDYYNHLNVYFSTNFANVKIDGSYLSMDVFWNWLREPVARGGGADGLVTFNHPGGDPALTPFDGDQPHNRLLGELLGGANWNDVAYVPDVDDRVVGMEVNGGDDIEWFVKALGNGWHIGPVAAEDEHEREWASSDEGKTLLLARGRTPRDYYFALQQQRTITVTRELVGGSPGTKAVVPTIHYWADTDDVNDPGASLLGSTITAPGPHRLWFRATGLPAGSTVALVGNRTGGQASPVPVGVVDGSGAITASSVVESPGAGEDWWFAVVCAPEVGADCGRDQRHLAVTAPIWLRS
jgi:hypothetical protein